jgi:hypothetical protein
MELEGSLPCSQEPATGPYPDPDETSPHLVTLISVRSILVLSSHLRISIPNGLFPTVFPKRMLYAFISFVRALMMTSLK